MSSTASPQHEPTMEEILASIRKIISDDQPEAAKPAPAPAPIPVRSVSAQPAPAPVPQPEADILELTEEVEEEEPAPEPVEEVHAPIENDIAFETIEPEPEAPAVDDDELISDSTRGAMGRAFAKLHGDSPKLSASFPGGTLEALFVQAIQDAFTPALQEWVDGHQAEIMDQMKPLIREWMDDHLPPLIEAAVTREIGRAAAQKPRRR